MSEVGGESALGEASRRKQNLGKSPTEEGRMAEVKAGRPLPGERPLRRKLCQA